MNLCNLWAMLRGNIPDNRNHESPPFVRIKYKQAHKLCGDYVCLRSFPTTAKIRYTDSMDGSKISGYREVEHTADQELEVWAPDLDSLLVEAAHGMYDLSEVTFEKAPRLERTFSAPYTDPESLLVDFLSELLFFAEDEGVAFDWFQVELDQDRCHCRLGGAAIASIGKEIKAVTYHRLEVQQTSQGLRVNIVFDV